MPRYRKSSWRGFDPEAQRPAAPAAAVPVAAAARCRVLGLDPGSLRTGYGLIDCDGGSQRFIAAGCIRPPAGPQAQRLHYIHRTLTALIDTHRPDEIAIERVFVARNPDSALKLGQARGVAMAAAVSCGAQLHEYAPRSVKLAVVGSGSAEKLQVAHMVKAMLGIAEPLGLDASDALALALCHAQSRRMAVLAGVVGGA
jgi:crossover junction endodeoxyribonuclease RuvC